jgi:hypothetical protein
VCHLNYNIGTVCIYWSSKIDNRLHFIGDTCLTSDRDVVCVFHGVIILICCKYFTGVLGRGVS